MLHILLIFRSLETAHLPAGSKDMGNGWIWDASIQRFMKKERTMKKEERVAPKPQHTITK